MCPVCITIFMKATLMLYGNVACMMSLQCIITTDIDEFHFHFQQVGLRLKAYLQYAQEEAGQDRTEHVYQAVNHMP